MYSYRSFGDCVQLCDHYHNQYTWEFKISSSSFAICSQLLYLGTTNVVSAITVLCFLVFHTDKIKQYIFFYISLTYNNAFKICACCWMCQYFFPFSLLLHKWTKERPCVLTPKLFVSSQHAQSVKKISSIAHWQ